MEEKTEKSFARLKSYVLSAAHKEGAGLAEKTEEEVSSFLDKKRAVLEAQYDRALRPKSEAERHSFKTEVLSAEFAAKKKLIEYRNSITDSVFDEVVERISVFKDTEKYKTWLIKKTNEALKACGGSGIIYASLEDLPLLEGINADKIARNMIGGVIVENTETGIAADYSIDELLSVSRRDFLRLSGMTIEI